MDRRWKCPPGLTAAQRKEAVRLRVLERGRSYQAAHVAAGRRTDGKPRAGKKPCGCLAGSCLKCANPGNKLHIQPETVAAMYADYNRGLSFEAVGRLYPLRNGKARAHGEISNIFRRRGLKVRPLKGRVPRLGFGVRIPEPSEKEIRELIARLDRLRVPDEMKIHWRKWPLAKRRAFVKKMRVKFPSTRPTTPFSSNVHPFEYGEPRVHRISAQMNAGRTSRTKVIALKPGSEGVIWDGQIFFWSGDYYFRGMGWRPGGASRSPLGQAVWEKHHRRPVPEKFTVIQKDGNKNNFAPKNLALRSMGECAILNSAHMQYKRNLTPENLKKKMRTIDRCVYGRQQARLQRSRAQTAALLGSFNSQKPETGLLATLQRRKDEPD